MRRLPAFRLFVLPVVLATGCGLSEYEARMSSEQARVHRIDEENRLLDDPIELPPPKDPPPAKQSPGGKEKEKEKEPDKNPRPEYFLRLPKGLSRTPSEKQQLYGNFLYVFPRVTKTGFQEVYFGFGKDSKPDFIRDVTKLFPSSGTLSIVKTEARPLGREPYTFDTVTIEDQQNSTLVIHACQRNGINVAVVYRMDRAKTEEMKRAMMLSLETLGVGGEVNALRKDFNRRGSSKSTR
jgi:hypothetical protein